MKKKNMKKYRKPNKFEKLLHIFAFLLLISAPFILTASQAGLSNVSYEVEMLKKEIVAQERTNQGLEMKINELASLDNIQAVAVQKGLSYNNNNIKSIDFQDR